MPYNPKSLANLKRGKKFRSDDDSASNAGRVGSYAAAEAKRAKKSMAEIARMVASAPVPEDMKKTRASLQMMGLEEDDRTWNAAVVAGVFRKAVDGDERAAQKIEEWTEAKAASDERYELPARVMGRAFVDWYRELAPSIKNVVEGGRGSVKSTTISEVVIELIKNNPMLHACIVRKVAGTLKDSVYAQIKWAINTLGLYDEFEYKKSPMEIVRKSTGQVIYFRGCDDPIKLKSIKPPFGSMGILWVEEADQLSGPEELRSVEQSVLRGSDTAYEFISYNPPKSREAWVNKELLIPDPKRTVHHSTYMDVPRAWLGTRFLDDAEHLKEVNPAAYEHEYLGVPNGDGGMVFDNIEARAITDEEIRRFDQIYQGTDWGWYPDPFAFIRLHYDANREIIYLLDEIGVNKTPNAQTARMIKDKGYNDTRITCDSAEPKSVSDFRACGLDAKEARKGPGSVEYGMKWLQGRRIVIDPVRTPMAYKEFTEYEYERDKEGNVVTGYPDKNNHFIDATRYATEQVWRRYWSIG